MEHTRGTSPTAAAELTKQIINDLDSISAGAILEPIKARYEMAFTHLEIGTDIKTAYGATTAVSGEERSIAKVGSTLAAIIGPTFRGKPVTARAVARKVTKGSESICERCDREGHETKDCYAKKKASGVNID
jgi:hypothetical protein